MASIVTRALLEMLKPYTVVSKINPAVHHPINLFDVVEIEDDLLTRLQYIHLL
jgi:hypothetical protein